MNVLNFGLGLRFDLLKAEFNFEIERQIWEEIFSVLTASDVSGLCLYSDVTERTREGNENIYQCIFADGSLNKMRKIYAKLSTDAGISMYLAAQRPYIQNNALEKIPEPKYLGRVDRSGNIEGGAGLPVGIRIPKKHGKKRPAGKGIKIILAPCAFGGSLIAIECVKRLTSAARRYFPGAKVRPVPISDGGKGFVNDAIMAADGYYRKLNVTLINGKHAQRGYGVLYGKTAVMELAALIDENAECQGSYDTKSTSFGLGEMIRRALDEGLSKIFIGARDFTVADGGMGMARALGVKFYDADDLEITDGSDMLSRIKKIDTEYLHPRLRETKVCVMCEGKSSLSDARKVYTEAHDCNKIMGGIENMNSILSEKFFDKASGQYDGVCGGIGMMLSSALQAEFFTGIEAYLDAVNFGWIMNGTALAVTARSLDNDGHRESIEHIRGLCLERRIIFADISDEIYRQCCVTTGRAQDGDQVDPGKISSFDIAADRAFQLIRIGRDVENYSPRKMRKFTIKADEKR